MTCPRTSRLEVENDRAEANWDFVSSSKMTGMTELSEHLFIQGVPALVSTGEAAVGRPLTPVSVAGVARRTARRN